MTRAKLYSPAGGSFSTCAPAARRRSIVATQNPAPCECSQREDAEHQAGRLNPFSVRVRPGPGRRCGSGGRALRPSETRSAPGLRTVAEATYSDPRPRSPARFEPEHRSAAAGSTRSATQYTPHARRDNIATCGAGRRQTRRRICRHDGRLSDPSDTVRATPPAAAASYKVCGLYFFAGHDLRRRACGYCLEGRSRWATLRSAIPIPALSPPVLG